MIWYQVIYAIICIGLAVHDAWFIGKGKPIDHIRNGAMHIIAAIIAWILFNWMAFFIVLCLARVIFNSALNLFRFHNLLYVSADPESKLDRFEKGIFGNNAWLPLLIYVIILIGLNVLYVYR